MLDFAAIDFETANNEAYSVCSVGVVVVRGGEIVDRFYSLIKPEPDYYLYFNTLVHGLTRSDTESAPLFPVVWAKIEPIIGSLPLVAHNKAFDERCLKEVFRVYQMDYPDYPFLCTLVAARRRRKELALENCKLDTVAAHFGYNMVNHHHALADAEACAAIALQIL